MLTVKMFGEEFELATTLRVAYVVQGQHNHKPYMDIFAGIDKMTVEDQIRIIYAAFKVKNRDTSYTEDQVVNWFLDNSTITDVMELVEKIIEGIVGKSMKDTGAKIVETSGKQSETPYVARPVQDSV